MKTIILTVLLAVLGLFCFGQDTGVISSLSGKVEIQKPGGAWQPAALNMVIDTGTTIATGFGARAVLTLDNAEIVVEQLTRMKLSELIKTGNTVKTELNLSFGTIDANVFKQEGLDQDFSLVSPISTASVRGTSFRYTGFSLEVASGMVRLINQMHQQQNVRQGGETKITATFMPLSQEIIKQAASFVNTHTAPLPPFIILQDRPKTKVTIKLQWN